MQVPRDEQPAGQRAEGRGETRDSAIEANALPRSFSGKIACPSCSARITTYRCQPSTSPRFYEAVFGWSVDNDRVASRHPGSSRVEGSLSSAHVGLLLWFVGD